MSDMCDLNWGRKSSEERLTQLGAWGSCTCHDHSSIFHILVCQKLLETVWDKKDLLNKFCKCHLTFSILSPLMNPFLIWYKYWHSISSSTAVFIFTPPPPNASFYTCRVISSQPLMLVGCKEPWVIYSTSKTMIYFSILISNVSSQIRLSTRFSYKLCIHCFPLPIESLQLTSYMKQNVAPHSFEVLSFSS